MEKLQWLEEDKQTVNSAPPLNWVALALYLLLHLLVCNLYFFLLLLNPGILQLGCLVALVGLTGIRAAISTGRRQKVTGGLNRTLLPLVVLGACLVLWSVAFPLYLAHRRYLKMKSGDDSSHQFFKRTR